MQKEGPSFSGLKISETTSTHTSSYLTLQFAIPLIILCAARWSGRPKKNFLKPQRLTDDKDNESIHQYEQRDCWKGFAGDSLVSVGCSWSHRRIHWINIIYSISRYVCVIQVNISDKSDMPVLFSFLCNFDFSQNGFCNDCFPPWSHWYGNKPKKVKFKFS